MSKNACRTVLLVFNSLIYPLYDSMCLFYCGVPLSEHGEMLGYYSFIFNH
jgi:hypothetical protein